MTKRAKNVLKWKYYQQSAQHHKGKMKYGTYLSLFYMHMCNLSSSFPPSPSLPLSLSLFFYP